MYIYIDIFICTYIYIYICIYVYMYINSYLFTIIFRRDACSRGFQGVPKPSEYFQKAPPEWRVAP